MKKRGSTSETRLTGLLQRSVRTLGSRKTPRSAGRLAGTGPDSNGPYAHEKPTKTGNVVGVPKRPPLPNLRVSIGLDIVRSPAGVVIGTGPARALFAVTQRGRRIEQVVLTGEGLDTGLVGPPLDYVYFLALAPEMARLLACVVDGRDPALARRARTLLAQLPFEVTP